MTMTSGWLVALEISLILGFVLGLAAWEWRSMRRWREQQRRLAEEKAQQPQAPDGP
jgi:hypothetical protein